MAIFATMGQVTPSNFRSRSYRLRGDRMTKAQAEAIASHWNKFEVPLRGKIDPRDLFYSLKPKNVIFEIGSGMGEATSEIAAANPNTGYVAVEVHKPGIGALIIRAEQLGIRNLRIINADIFDVLTNHIDDNQIDGFHIFFPDPWPKRRQNKRRLLQPEFIELLSRKLKSGGEISIATDWIHYAEEIESNFRANTSFTGGKIQRPAWRPITKFEGKGISKEHVVTDFSYLKI
jgi:tRNA (guanine-N7-)-methyltransferase